MRTITQLLCVAFVMASLPQAAAAQSDSGEEKLLVEASLLESALEPWTGDLDGIVQRKMIRVAIPYGIATYFLDGPHQKGITYDLAVTFERSLRKQLKLKETELTLVVVPARRDEIFEMLVDGKADVAAGSLTITPERAQIVDFSIPFRSDVNEVVVTGPEIAAGADFAQLEAIEIFVRPSSSYFSHLAEFNEDRKRSGQALLSVQPVDEVLNTEDLVDMVNAGLLPATIVDEPLADFLTRIYDHIVVHKNLSVSGPNAIGWAFRKDSPQLGEAINSFMTQARMGTKSGNTMLQNYLKSTKWAERVLSSENVGRLRNLIPLFQEYAQQYDFDWLMIGAQGYQESKLDQSARSKAGAIGIMQLLPSTAADPYVGIPDISTERNNIHAGVRYLRHLQGQYFSDPKITALDRTLLSFAAYNAGPGNIAKARRLAAKMGLNPDVWFDNVELAAARAISREPVIYVRNIYKYYVAYRRIADQLELRRTKSPG